MSKLTATIILLITILALAYLVIFGMLGLGKRMPNQSEMDKMVDLEKRIKKLEKNILELFRTNKIILDNLNLLQEDYIERLKEEERIKEIVSRGRKKGESLVFGSEE